MGGRATDAHCGGDQAPGGRARGEAGTRHKGGAHRGEDPRRRQNPGCRACDSVRVASQRAAKSFGNVTKEKYVAGVLASTFCAARHGTTLKWSFAVNCKALDGGKGVEDGGSRARTGHDHTNILA